MQCACNHIKYGFCSPTAFCQQHWTKLSGKICNNLLEYALTGAPCAMQNFCEKAMGSRYVNQDAFSPATVMGEASSSTPIFFILFPGYSPSKEIEAYARDVSHTVENGKLTLISMGQVWPAALFLATSMSACTVLMHRACKHSTLLATR